jgi:regulator of telomere elongation helicase 1
VNSVDLVVIDALNGKKHALLQSPTGTGKTLCLLCATLAWLKHHRETTPVMEGEEGIVRIIYSSRTHSQLKQVQSELGKTIYRPKSAILASRDQLCVNKQLAQLKGAQLNAACKKARQKDHSCTFYEEFSKCAFCLTSLIHIDEKQILSKFSERILDIEEICSNGASNKFCPYYFQRRLIVPTTLAPRLIES